MAELLFAHFHAATLSMSPDGGLLLHGARERMLAWGIVFCLVAATALSVFLSGFRRRGAISIFLVSLLIPLQVMPSVRQERIHVLSDRITLESGSWLLPSREIIDLAGLESIREHQVQYRLAGYLVEPNGIWELRYRDGRIRQVLLSDFFTAHRTAIAQYLRDRGRLVL